MLTYTIRAMLAIDLIYSRFEFASDDFIARNTILVMSVIMRRVFVSQRKIIKQGRFLFPTQVPTHGQ